MHCCLRLGLLDWAAPDNMTNLSNRVPTCMILWSSAMLESQPADSLQGRSGAVLVAAGALVQAVKTHKQQMGCAPQHARGKLCWVCWLAARAQARCQLLADKR